ncbi:hypothetical protein D3C83_161840 [compost metagenome]
MVARLLDQAVKKKIGARRALALEHRGERFEPFLRLLRINVGLDIFQVHGGHRFKFQKLLS